MYAVKCDSPACDVDAEIEEVEIPDGWLVIIEHKGEPGEEQEELELGVFCSRACAAYYAGMEAPD